MKKNFILQLAILGLILGAIVYLTTIPGCQSKSGQRASKKVTVHQYDYLVEVSDSANAILYSVYDEKHQLVGAVLADKLDSLIIADNQ